MKHIEEEVEKLFSKNTKVGNASLQNLIKISESTNEVYPYFDQLIELMQSDNSYFRNRGIMLIAKNAKWDQKNKVNGCIESYLSHIEDEKPITARICIQSLEEFITYKKELIPLIQNKLTQMNYSKYKASMAPLLYKDVSHILELLP